MTVAPPLYAYVSIFLSVLGVSKLLPALQSTHQTLLALLYLKYLIEITIIKIDG